MSSRFFARGGDSDSESSDSEESLYDVDGSEEESQEDSEEDSEEEDEDESDDDSSDDDGATGVNRFLKAGAGGVDSDESDEGETTVVKSAKDKRLDELEGLIKKTDDGMRIQDFQTAQKNYDEVVRAVPNVTRQMNGKTPKVFIKMLAELDDSVREAHEKAKVTPKKMNALNAKALNSLRQKIKKILKESNYEDEVKSYREDPDEYMEEEEEEVPVQRQARGVSNLGTSTAGDDDAGFEVVGPGGRTLAYTPESILKNLRGIAESRGRKGTDRNEQIRIMEKLMEVAATDYQKIRVLLSLVSARFDTTSATTGAISVEQWKQAHTEFVQLVDLLAKNKDQLVVIEGAEEWEDDEKQPTFTPGKLFTIPGSVVGSAERLDDELTRSLLAIDPHTSDYVSRLTDETAAYADLLRAQIYEETIRKQDQLKERVSPDRVNSIILKRLEHLHFRHNQLASTLEKDAWSSLPEGLNSEISPIDSGENPEELVKALTNYLFKHSEGIQRARAILHRIYFVALHDQYYDAKNMMLMSHLSESISSFDIVTQIHYNRTLVQVGLAAFRLGLIWESQTALQEICGSNRQKELLAQGVQVQRYSTLTPEQERAERLRQLPFHMHINIELLEACYLVVSMLLEIPLLASLASLPDQRRRVISKAFRRLLDYSERSVFQGPPENTRDHILQASKALSAGDYKRSVELIRAIKIWDLIPSKSDEIRNMLESKIKETGLETYLLTYAPFYETIFLSTLSSMFDLTEIQVSAIVAKMISHEDLAAALDQVSGAIIFRKGVDLSRLQALALTLSDKASNLIESNEKVLEQRTQGTANAFERQGGQGGRGGRGGRGRGGGGLGRIRGGARGGGFTGGALGNAIRT